MNLHDYYHQLSSNRLLFRKFTLEDVESWMEFYEHNPSLPYLGLNLNRTQEAMAKAWIESQTRRYEQNGFGQLAVIAKATGELIGSRGFRWAEYQGQNRLHSMGAFKPAYWRQGFGSESAVCLYNFVFQNTTLEHIFSRCHIDNKASQANLTKLGFVLQEQIQLPERTIFIWRLSKKTWGKRWR